jgi:isoleucyl-tRNA synthetase
VWGVPIPAFYCVACNQPILTRETAAAFEALVAEHGADVWFERSAAELAPPGLTCPRCGGTEFRKETDIQDVWFDSGASHYCVQRHVADLTYPADLYLEGDDQYQCWFQSSLWVACALGDGAPFRTVLGHGFFVDDKGQKMSKSRGNIVGPEEITERYGADVLRLWFIYADYRAKMPCSERVHRLVADTYRTIRNAWRFQLMNLADFDPQTMGVPAEELSGLDRYLLARLRRLVARVTRHHDGFDLHLVYHDANGFCATDLSALYHNAAKDVLYCDAPDSPRRRAVQTVLWEAATHLARLLAPVLPFTTEEVWRHLREKQSSLPPSVHLADFPEPEGLLDCSPAEEFGWQAALEARELALQQLEALKASGELSNPLEGQVRVGVSGAARDALGGIRDLPGFFGVSEVVVETSPAAQAVGWVVARPGSSAKCERCWRREASVSTQPDESLLCRRCAEVVGGRA